ncbi:aminoglycoside phosphotransferase family protein, partial [Streptomyces sp. SID9124]|nr:aminoglycoside phosphotransferase family protein [Streptomyces sp. SID9124]
MTTALVRALGDLAHAAVHPAGCGPRACPPPSVLADRDDGTVVRSGPVVAKAHAAGTDTTALAVRLRLAAGSRQDGILLAPLPAAPGAHLTELHGRPVTLWPQGEPVDPGDPDAAPWEEAGALLARL